MRLPYFSRAQLSVILLLGAALLGLYAWRARPFFAPSPPPPGIMHLTFVEVAGKAAHPGIYSFSKPPTLREVWQRAGATGTPADPDQKIASGTRVEVTPAGGYRLTAMSGAKLVTLGLPIDLNRASVQDLEAIPGIGPVLAHRIVDFRKAHGPFKKIDELQKKISGFGPKKLEAIKPYLSINAALTGG
jgi:competence protein ComEA